MNSNRTQHVATFRFSDTDISEIGRLEAEGFKFATVTMRDRRGYERAFKVWCEKEWTPNSEPLIQHGPDCACTGCNEDRYYATQTTSGAAK